MTRLLSWTTEKS